jgi:hypothetical protein
LFVNEEFEKTLERQKEIVKEIYTEHACVSEIITEGMKIRTEFLRRDFTKRQIKILVLIYSFSYPYGKKKAYIPMLQDFELGGISKTKIKGELDKLIEMKVIDCDEENGLYGIKDPKGWEVPYHNMFVNSRARELFLLNLKHAGIDVSTFIDKN